MTKKRFIKLLMSHGEQINRARAIAFLYNARGIPYKEAYRDYLFRTSFIRSMSKLGEACARLGTNIASAAQSLGKLANALKQGGI